MPLEAYEYPKTELIVPLMALMEAQVVILYLFFCMSEFTFTLIPSVTDDR